ncbi:hypothetical protein EYD45_07980 [Hyunsoonleella flava]|uniref:Uncharacterized protein n=1 Tax=Hyunsoonleella flava TaxID=2527939 RepID=A0A4Q9FJ72_9FLAO|nr:hypothetical protein [Hyunsoonleella flava]TBN03944.1 hypothetical protein EYD45_07980 [Hyunsoonleella flava]
MENQIKNIELINSYLNKSLSGKAMEDFENRLKTDEGFKLLYDEHLILLEGIKRQKIKSDIKAGKQRYLRGKWLRYLGFGSAIIVLTVISFNLFNSEKNDFYNKLNFESDFKQEFKIALDSIIEVKGEKGTVLRFNPDDLETKSGAQLSSDSLTVELIELSTKQDLLLAKAQTVSNGKWLISGGAFKIDISQGSNTLVLKEGKTIDVTLPKNTNESDMKLFYGKRDAIGNMNWAKSRTSLREKEYYTIFIKDTTIIDEELTRRYGGVVTFRNLFTVDTIGNINSRELNERFPKLNYYDKNVDTLRVYKTEVELVQNGESYSDEYYEVFEIDSLSMLDGQKEIVVDSVLVDLDDMTFGEGYTAFADVYRQISKEDFDQLKIDQENSLEVNRVFKHVNEEIYESIKLSKLGWINIDKFASNEVKVNIALNANINADYEQLYLVDQSNNTILNVYENTLDLPVNRSFYLIGIAQKGKTIFGFKKAVRFSKSESFQIKYREIKETQIKSVLTIE